MSVLDNDQLDVLQSRYTAERPMYAALMEEVKARVCLAAQGRDVHWMCSGRTKEIDSFLKKALLKEYTDPYEQIRDKAGVRLVVSFVDQVSAAEHLVRDTFLVHDYTDKNQQLAVDQLGYRGIHFEVMLPEATIRQVNGKDEDLQGLICEIQVHTRALNLWNEATHPLVYKPFQTTPDAVKRRIYRLVALMELFDDELVAARSAIANQPGAEAAAMLFQLESNYARLTGRGYNKEFSFEVLDVLRDLMSSAEVEQFESVLSRFVDKRTDQLTGMYEDYRESQDPNPLIFQPETILLLERLERDRFALRDRWAKEYPLSLLENLANIWGISLQS